LGLKVGEKNVVNARFKAGLWVRCQV